MNSFASRWNRCSSLRIVLAMLLVPVGVWLFVVGADTVWAHALLVRSTPPANAELTEPPDTIEMWFSEPLEAGFSDARLLDSTGDEVETGAVSIDPSDPTHMTLPLGRLEPGIYTVAWQTLSQVDGHEWYGSFPFTVLRADGSRPAGGATDTVGSGRGELPGPDEVATRWLALLGAILMFGAPLFQIVVVRARTETLLGMTAGTLTATVLVVAVGGIVLGGWLQVLFQALRLGEIRSLPDLLFETRTGVLTVVRQTLAATALCVATYLLPPLRRRLWGVLALIVGFVGLSLLLLAVAALRSSPLVAAVAIAVVLISSALAGWLWLQASPDAQERRAWQIVLGLAAGILLSFSASSHAGAVPGSGWAILGDYLHLLAAATWIGGLVLLPVLVWRLRRHDSSYDMEHLLVLVRRFSYLAGAAVFVLAVTGVFSSLVELPSLSSLINTAYGQVLLAKLLLIGLALEIAFFNNRLVHRSTDHLRTQAGLRRFNRRVAIEAAVAVGVMLVVAVLVQTPAPRSLTTDSEGLAPDQPFNTITQAGDLYVHAQVTPNTVGNNRFWVHLYHADGSPIGEVQLVRLFFEYREEQLGQASVDLTPQGDDTFAVEGAYLNQSGAWDLSVYVRRRGMEDVITDVRVEVPPPAGKATDASPWQNPIPNVPPELMIAALFVALGVVPFIWRRPLAEIAASPWPVIAGTTCLLVGISLGLVSGQEWLAERAAGRPIPASPSSVATGARLYQENCAECHGSDGMGNGPAAAGLEPPPANLPLHVPLHDKRELHGYVENGFPGTAMPAFEGRLSSEEMWHVVNYLQEEFGRR